MIADSNHAHRLELILAAQRDGYRVEEAPENVGWWQVHVPARPRYPANVQGDFPSSDRAWSVAASLALDARQPDLEADNAASTAL